MFGLGFDGLGERAVDVHRRGFVGHHHIDMLPIGFGIAGDVRAMAATVIVVVPFESDAVGFVEETDVMLPPVRRGGRVAGGVQRPAGVATGIGLGIVGDGDGMPAFERRGTVLGLDIAQPEAAGKPGRGGAVAAGAGRGFAVDGRGHTVGGVDAGRIGLQIVEVVVDQQILVVLVVAQRYGSCFGCPFRRGGLRRHRGAGTHDESGHKRCSADNGTDRFRHSSFMHDYPR